jgi:hypothetical protein
MIDEELDKQLEIVTKYGKNSFRNKSNKRKRLVRKRQRY